MKNARIKRAFCIAARGVGLQRLAGELFEGFDVLGAGAGDDVGREFGAGGDFAPVQGFQVVADVLLVVGRRVLAFFVLVGGPEAGGVRGQGFVDQVQGAGCVDAEFELGVGDQDAPAAGVGGGFFVQLDC